MRKTLAISMMLAAALGLALARGRTGADHHYGTGSRQDLSARIQR